MNERHRWGSAGGVVICLVLWVSCSGGGQPGDGGQDGSDGTGGDAEPCQGVACDTPPPNECQDGTTLKSYSTPGDCEALTGECRYPFTLRPCGSGCSGGACLGLPPDRVELYAPDPTQLCTTFSWGGDSVEWIWQNKARLTLTPGSHVLPLDQDSFAYELIDRVEVSTEGETLVPDSPGQFTRELLGDPTDGELQLRFRQAFLRGGVDRYLLDVSFSFPLSSGVPDEPSLVLDERALSRGPRFAGTFGAEYTATALISCSRALLEERSRAFLAVNGDRLAVRSRGWIEQFGWPVEGDTFFGEVEEATFTREDQVRQTSDFFDLASTVNHHGYAYSYWMHLDLPLGEVHNLMIDEFSYGHDLLYLDAQGQILDRQPWTEEP